MKSSKKVNMKQKSASSNKVKKRKKLSTGSPTNSSELLASCNEDSCVNKNQSNLEDAKSDLINLTESVPKNLDNNKQTESANVVKIKLKRGRKTNKDRHQQSCLNLRRNQSDLQTFVQKKTEQFEESKINIDVAQISKEEENCFSGNHIENRKNYKRKKLKSPEDTHDKIIFNSTMNNSFNDDMEETVHIEEKNAFKVMMENRKKVIGRNSPGKDLEVFEINDSITESKLKLSARKLLLQDWSNVKGGLKRKIDEAEKQLCINEKLEMRAKRMKNMLSLSSNNKGSDTVSKRKKVRKIISDSESSSDEILNKKVNHILDDSIYCESDTDKQVNVIKIKMFSPEVFKRRRRNKEDNTNSNLKNCNFSKGIVDAEANKVSKDHKNGEATNTKMIDKEKNLRRSSRKSTKVNYYDSDFILLTSDTEESSNSYISDKPKSKECRKSKKMKIAPVFLKATPKPKVDPTIIEARKQFLMSGVPDSLKKVIDKQQILNDMEYDVFPTISHIQQKTSNEQNLMNYWSLPSANLNCIENEKFIPDLKEISLLSMLNCIYDNHKALSENPVIEMKNIKSILKKIKSRNPDYPVFRTFRLLRDKFELHHKIPNMEKPSVKKKQNHKRTSQQQDDNADNYILWTEKFKAKTSDDIIGNHTGVLKLKKWLISWVKYSRETKLWKAKDSSSSDFDSSDSENSNNRKIPSNAVILVGPHGSGKTMTIYAICNELHINVLELNASDKRTGKRLLQKLQEATRSHQVRKNDSGNLSCPDLNQQVKKEKMCLLIVDDIDVIFDQDEAFLSALAQLLQTSKRPIVLVTTDKNCGHLQKFIVQYPIIKFTALSANVLSVWLQILCLIEGVKIDEKVVGNLLEWNKGDARQTLLQLQFWMQNTEKKPLVLRNSTESCSGKILSNNEKSNHSHLNDMSENDLQKIVIHSNQKQFYVNEMSKSENLWWNLSSFLDISPLSHNFHTCNDQTEKKDEEFYKLQKCKNVFNTFAMVDSIYTKLNLDYSAEPSPKMYQQNYIKDSMELCENMNTYNSSKEVVTDWIDYLLSNQLNLHAETDNKMTCLTSQERRWRSKQYNCENKFLELVSLSYYTDRRAFSLDYFPTLRTVARSEKQRAITNNKRGNRFCNYLSTLGFSHKDAITQTACDILNINKDTR